MSLDDAQKPENDRASDRHSVFGRRIRTQLTHERPTTHECTLSTENVTQDEPVAGDLTAPARVAHVPVIGQPATENGARFTPPDTMSSAEPVGGPATVARDTEPWLHAQAPSQVDEAVGETWPSKQVTESEQLHEVAASPNGESPPTTEFDQLAGPVHELTSVEDVESLPESLGEGRTNHAPQPRNPAFPPPEWGSLPQEAPVVYGERKTDGPQGSPGQVPASASSDAANPSRRREALDRAAVEAVRQGALLQSALVNHGEMVGVKYIFEQTLDHHAPIPAGYLDVVREVYAEPRADEGRPYDTGDAARDTGRTAGEAEGSLLRTSRRSWSFANAFEALRPEGSVLVLARPPASGRTITAYALLARLVDEGLVDEVWPVSFGGSGTFRRDAFPANTIVAMCSSSRPMKKTSRSTSPSEQIWKRSKPLSYVATVGSSS